MDNLATDSEPKVARARARLAAAACRGMLPAALGLLAAAVAQPARAATAAAQVAAQPAARLLGTVTAVSGDTVTLKLDSGAAATIKPDAHARVLRATPGEKSLANATVITLGDIAVGDRVLVRATSGASDSYTANLIVAMKQADIAGQQQARQADWQRRGVGGVVKSVDAAAGTVSIVTALGRPLTVQTTPATVIRRYAPNSIKFSDAKTGTLQDIQSGDQLRVRGDRSPAGTEVKADEIVSGTFRNIAGIVDSVDEQAETIILTDLATKKPVTIHLNTDTQMHQLPMEAAQRIAMRAKASPAAQGAGGQQQRSPDPSENGAAQETGSGQTSVGARGNGDVAQLIQRSPLLQLSAVHKGQALMIVATEDGTAITLLAGVEPLLEANAGQSVFSAQWNLSSGGGEEAVQQ